MAFEGGAVGGLGVKGPPLPAPSGLGSPWPVLGRGPPSTAARSRTSTRRGPTGGGGPRRWPAAGAADAPSTRAAAAARAAMLQQRRRLPGAAPVTRSSADAPRSGLPWGVGSDSGVTGPPGAPESVGGPPCSSRSRQVLLEALMRIKKKDKKQFFAVAVDSKLVPDYHLVVRNPMHFEAMREKIENGVYQEFSEFDKDIALIVSNCRLYNHPDTPFCRAAALVEGCWEKFRERFRAKFTAAQQADAAAAAAAAAATEGKEDKHAAATVCDRPEDQAAEKDAVTEQQGEVVRSVDAEEVPEFENLWPRQRLVASLLMRSASNPRAAAALGLLQPQSIDSGAAPQVKQSQPAEDAEVVSSNPLTDPFFWFSFILPDAALEAEAAERAAPGDAATEGPLGAAFSKGFNVVEYPLPPHPGSRPMRRHQARNLSYNASISDFLGAEALQRLEADCPQLRLTVRRLKQKEPPKAPLTDIRLFGIDTPDFSEFNSRLRFDQSLLLGVGEAHVLSARTLSRVPAPGGPSAAAGGALGAPAGAANRSLAAPSTLCTDVLLALCGNARVTSSTNPVGAAVFAQEQQQMRLRLLQAAAKAAATAGTTLGGATQRAAADEGKTIRRDCCSCSVGFNSATGGENSCSSGSARDRGGTRKESSCTFRCSL
ncbi:uncharacterized protein EMH_0040220 [Eimeria mitis]|uniref:Bromo domain-containing protein n=1 Tax=Eimeria mitis TaxID=44415 RepID=U6JUE0_9EIME|nr:uncharacterized protein EMH_0040220 [Eimeria mitis]CDJ28356.1 hypothetical protein, conserved [Eimeria mitis]